MGDIRIRFRMNLETGLKDITIEYDSDEDMLRHEHERRHREIVRGLVGSGVLAEGEVGDIKVERLRDGCAGSDEGLRPPLPEGQANAG